MAACLLVLVAVARAGRDRPCCDRRGDHDRGGDFASRGRRRLDRGRVEEVRRRA